MPHMQIHIKSFEFITFVQPNRTCRGDLRSGVFDLKYKLRKKKEVRIRNTRPRRPPSPPAPPAPEPPTPRGRDPVLMLQNHRWVVTREVMSHEPPYPSTGQPAGYRKTGDFERLELVFQFPFFCRCHRAGGKCNVTRLELKVSYDGAHHPKVSVLQSPVKRCGAVQSVYTLQPTKKIKSKPAKLVRVPGGAGLHKIEYNFPVPLKCECPRTREPREQPARRRADKCLLGIEVDYRYVTEMVDD